MPIVSDGQLNLAALQTDDVYIVIVPPQTPLIPGFPTDGIGIVGSASRGPLNTPVLVTDPASLVRTFGDVALSSNDISTEIISMLKQGANNIFGVRVSDGTEVSATGNLISTVPSNLIGATGITPGIWANLVNVIIGIGSDNVATPAIQNLVVGGSWVAGNTAAAVIAGTSVTYTAVAGDTNATVASGLAAAINANAITKLLASATIDLVSSAKIILTAKSVLGTAFNTTTLTTIGTVGGTVTASNATFAGVTSGGVAGIGTQTYKVTITSATDPTEVFDRLSGIAGNQSVAGSAALAVVNAVNNGITGIRGPSAIITGGAPTAPGSGTLINQTVTLSGGLDGRAGVGTSQLLGVDGVNRTGMFALRGLPIFQFGIAGLRDTTSWATQVAFAVSENLLAVLGVATGKSSQQAVIDKNTAAIDDYHAVMVKDDFWLNDTVNKQIRLVSPIGVTLGRIGALSPERSPGNKPLFGFLGTERTGIFQSSSFKPGIPYSSAEIGLLESGGILFATTPAVGGNFLAFRHGQNTASDPTRNGVNYSRLTLFLARSLLGAMGFAVNEVHTVELRRRVKSAIAQFLSSLADPGPGRSPMIGDVNGGPAFSIVVDQTNNPDNLVALGYLFVSVQVKYLSIVRFFVISVEAGQSVTVKVSSSPVVRPSS